MINKQVLVLNQDYSFLNFVDDYQAIIFILKGKVDIVSTWDNEVISTSSQLFEIPSIIRFKYFIKRRFTGLPFSRKMVFRRDQYVCQYCSTELDSHSATIDHLIPQALNGPTNYLNCVTSCFPCNNKKGNSLLHDTSLKLLNAPYVPFHKHFFKYKDWNSSWDDFLRNVPILKETHR